MLFFYTYRTFNKDFLPNVGYKENLKNEIKYRDEDYFPYYKNMYRQFSLIKLIIYKYLLALIGPDIEYIELEDIHNYLDEIFPKLNAP